MISKHLLIVGVITGLYGCQARTTSPVAASMDQILQEQETMSQSAPAPLAQLPEAVSQTLLAPQEGGSEGLFGGNKYDINAQQVDAVSFFSGLVKDTPYSVAIHPEVSGSISLDLKQVELEEVFELVSDLYGYDIQRNKRVFKVYPAGMRTETFSVNYLLMQRDGATQTSITTGGISQANGNNNRNNNNGLNNFSGNSTNSNNVGGNNLTNNINGTSIQTRTETDFWTDLTSTLQTLIGDDSGRSVVVTPQAGLVTVRALPDEIRTVKEFLHASEEIIQRQVVLEARILEVSLSDEFQQGINWTRIISDGSSTDFTFSNTSGNFGNSISAALGGLTSLSFVNNDFSGVLSLLSTQGNVQVSFKSAGDGDKQSESGD